MLCRVILLLGMRWIADHHRMSLSVEHGFLLAVSSPLERKRNGLAGKDVVEQRIATGRASGEATIAPYVMVR